MGRKTKRDQLDEKLSLKNFYSQLFTFKIEIKSQAIMIFDFEPYHIPLTQEKIKGELEVSFSVVGINLWIVDRWRVLVFLLQMWSGKVIYDIVFAFLKSPDRFLTVRELVNCFVIFGRDLYVVRLCHFPAQLCTIVFQFFGLLQIWIEEVRLLPWTKSL